MATPSMPVEVHYCFCFPHHDVHQNKLHSLRFALKFKILNQKNNETVILINEDTDRQSIEEMVAFEFPGAYVRVALYDTILENIEHDLEGQYVGFEFPKSVSLVPKLLTAVHEKGSEKKFEVMCHFMVTNKDDIKYLKCLGMEQEKYGNELRDFMKPEELEKRERMEEWEREMKERYRSDSPDLSEIYRDADGFAHIPAKWYPKEEGEDDDDDDYDVRMESDEDEYVPRPWE
ncbi:hypothetical protein GCK72_000274 [Caenorhabditis remanei]|uniref:Uncharacterized protein n=1 Tax=Caenorhabditis remanei TaxID=31234 RepID=A0A6A5HRT2_CAERE|nr:hypothetical protein GCK72_000274 [Caenorhabditis remanei]KAF1768462.1 hypothetical protein GCK72_000274 [Caenorhabditis remanei]